jgi:uncharacterized membrane protein YidH (DUF202 family)
MKLNKIIGIILILVGIAMAVTGGFSFEQKKKVLNTDAIDISTKETKTVSWPPIVGSIVVLGGIAVLLLGGNKNRKVG